MPSPFPVCSPVLLGPAEAARLRSQIHHADPGRYWRELSSHARLLGEFRFAADCDRMAEAFG